MKWHTSEISLNTSIRLLLVQILERGTPDIRSLSDAGWGVWMPESENALKTTATNASLV